MMLVRDNMKPEKNSRLHGESGQALIITSLVFVLLIGFVGLCVDAGLLLRAKTNLQKVADAAAVAGAAEYTSGNWSAAAIASAAQNGIDCAATGITCNVSIGTTAHPTAVSVYIAQPQQIYLASLFGYSTMTVGARAAAGLVTGSVCMYALDNSATAPKGYGITVNGSGNASGIVAPQCNVYDNADASLNGSHQEITAASIGIAGTIKGSGTTSPAAITGLLPVPDPLANYWSLPSFTPSNGNLTATTGQVSPGVYNNFSVSGTATLQPGLYVIQGNLNLNVASASGVTFYVDSANGGTLSCNPANCNFGGTLTAPPLGTGTTGSCSFASGCNGLLLWDTETTSFPKTVTIGSVSLTGMIYAPLATLTLGGSTTATFDSDIVAGAYVINGDVSMSNYVANSGAGSPFKSTALME